MTEESAVPLDLISREEAISLLGSRNVYEQLRRDGDLPVAKYRPQRGAGGLPTPLHRRSIVERVARQRERPSPENWVLVRDAVREYGIAPRTLYKWVNDWCVLLGEKVKPRLWKPYPRSQHTLTYLPRAALERCQSLREDRKGKRCPRSGGVWETEETYRDADESLWVTVAYVCERYQVHPQQVRTWCGFRNGRAKKGRPRAPGGLALGHQLVQKPGVRPHGGQVLVLLLDDVKTVFAWRQGEGKKGWRSEEEYVADDGKVWVTNVWLQRRYGVSEMFAVYRHKRGELPRSSVWKPHSSSGRIGGKIGKPVWVYRLDEAEQLIAQRASAATSANAPPPPASRARSGSTASNADVNGATGPKLVAAVQKFEDRGTHQRLDGANQRLDALHGLIEGMRGAKDGPPVAAGSHPPASVQLLGPNNKPVVCGVKKAALCKGAYQIVRALLDAYPGSLTKGELEEKSEYTDAHKWLAELARDPEWNRAIYRPGRGRRDGYRIRGLVEASAPD
jgi:transposase-like protein